MNEDQAGHTGMHYLVAGRADTPSLLAPNEAPAPIANLSPSKRAALIACVKGDGTLQKYRGVWKSPCGDHYQKPIFGVTVADLSREGMMTFTVLGKHAVAQLTLRGSWYARTAASDVMKLAAG
jgi:hypothetical protein